MKSPFRSVGAALLLSAALVASAPARSQGRAASQDTLGVDALLSALAQRQHLFGAAAVDECSVLNSFQEDSTMLARFRRGERGSKPAPGGPARCRAPDPDDPMSPEWWIRLEEVRIGDDGRGVVEIVARHPGEFRRESYEIDRKIGHSFVTESRIERSIATNDYQALVLPKGRPVIQPTGPISSADSLRAEAVITALRTRASIFGPAAVSRCGLHHTILLDDRLIRRIAESLEKDGSNLSDSGCARSDVTATGDSSWWIVPGMLQELESRPRVLHLLAYRRGERRESYIFNRGAGKLRVTEVRITP